MTLSDNSGDQRIKPDPSVGPSGRWVKIALAVSLAINLAIAGIVVGAMMRDSGGMRNTRLVGDLGFGPFTDALSKKDRAELRRAFLATAPDLRDARRARQSDFRELLVQLRAVPFDPNALRTAFDRQNTRNADQLQLGQRLIFDLLVGMTDEARQTFATRLEESLAKGPKPKDGQPKP